MDPEQVSQSPARSPQAPRIAADRMLGRLARWLRLAGADVTFDSHLGGGDLLRQARAQGRIVVTRDKRLRTAPDVIWLDSNDVRGQMREVLSRVPIDAETLAFTRCSRCNTPLRPVSREIAVRRVPPFVYASQERFAQCDGCGRIYWDATHPERMLGELRAVARHAGGN
jgi:uncharacterized protein with PIN domain